MTLVIVSFSKSDWETDELDIFTPYICKTQEEAEEHLFVLMRREVSNFCIAACADGKSVPDCFQGFVTLQGKWIEPLSFKEMEDRFFSNGFSGAVAQATYCYRIDEI
jgi:hypothetical protein